MKKKMLFMAALAGAVTLASCVKDDVSASVEAVRNAKINQLNSQATLNEAQAVYYAAMGANQAANAARQELDNQIRQATKTQEIDAALADYARQIADSKQQEQNSLNRLADDLRTSVTANSSALITLLGNYNTQLIAYYGALRTVAQAQTDLAKAKVDTTYAKQLKETALFADYDQIAESEALIAKYKEIKTSGKTQEELDAEASAKSVDLVNQTNTLRSGKEIPAFISTSKTLAEKYEAYDEYVDFSGAGQGKFFDANTIQPGTFAEEVSDDVTDANKYFAYDSYSAYTYVNAVEVAAGSGGTPQGTATADGAKISPAVDNYDGSIKSYKLNTAVYDNKIADLQNDINNAETNLNDALDELGTPSDVAGTKRKINNTYENTLYAQLAEAGDSLTSKNTKLSAQLDSITDGKAKLADAEKLTDATAKAAAIIAAKKKIGDALKEVFGDNGYALPATPDNDDMNEYIFDDFTAMKATFSVIMYGDATTLTDVTSENIDEIMERFYVDKNIAAGWGYPTSMKITQWLDKDGQGITIGRVNNGLQNEYDDAVKDKYDAQDDVNTALNNINKDLASGGLQASYDDAVLQKSQYEEAVKAVDLTAYETVCKDLKDAMVAFNAAAEALGTAVEPLDALDNEVTALMTATIAGTDVDKLIADEEQNIANAKHNIEAWDLTPGNDYAKILEQAEETYAEALATLDAEKAELDEIKKQIEALLALQGDETGPLDGDDAVGPVDGEDNKG